MFRQYGNFFCFLIFFFFRQKTAYELRISDWSSDVCSSDLFMFVSIEGFGDALHHPNVSLDPSRVAAQVASGIGFLGAGAILMRRGVVHGLTTAASLWAVAALGLAVGGGLYGAAIAATLIMLFILLALKPLEKRYVERRGTRRVVLLRGPRDNLRYEDVAAALGGRAKRIRQFIVTPDTDKADAVEVNIVLACANAREYDGIRDQLCNLARSEEHTSELQSLMRTSYRVFCMKEQTEKQQHD